jgi:hypothetical protein
VGNIKTIGDGSKVFFHEHQFSLAFGEKKSILRNKKRALEYSGDNSRRERKQRERKKCARIIFILDKEFNI